MDEVSKILVVILMIVLFALLVLVALWVYLRFKSKSEDKKQEKVTEGEQKSKVQQEYSIQSIFNFMEFDKIEDNMIIQNHPRLN